MGKFLEGRKLLKLTQEVIENLNRSLKNKETESVIKKPPTKKSPGPECFTEEFYQILEDLRPIFHKLFQ